MRNAVLFLALLARAGAQPDADRDRTDRRHRFADDGQPVRENTFLDAFSHRTSREEIPHGAGAFFAVRKPYGRGLIICILFMVFTVFMFVPRQQSNYYHIIVLWMAMVCGFFPLSDFKSLNLRSALLSVIVFLGLIILNFTFFIMFLKTKSNNSQGA